MECQRCGSARVLSAQGKCSDLCFARIGDGPEHDGYVPKGLGIGAGDNIDIDLCLDCGQAQGEFPRPHHPTLEPADEE